MGILDNIQQKFSGGEGQARLYGLGLLASQMGAGQTPNAGPALQMLQDRRAQRELASSMQGGEFLSQFTPQEQSFLATLPPAAAQQLIAQRIFARPEPVAGVDINDQLVNPLTGEVMGDFRTDEPSETYRQLTAEEITANGLDPSKAYQVAPDGKISQIGGNGVHVETNVGGGESAFDKKTGEILAQEAAAVVESGSNAQRSMGQLITLEGALKNAPEGMVASIKNWAGQLGIKTEGSSDIELANAIINQLVPGQRPAGSGQMSDKDLELFKQSLPQLINTREGNAKIISTMRAILEYDVARGQIARRLQLGEIGPAEAFAEYEALGNPLAEFAASAGGEVETSGAPLSGPTPQEIEGMTPAQLSTLDVSTLSDEQMSAMERVYGIAK